MSDSINIKYCFLSTGNLDFKKVDDLEINVAQRVFSRLIGSLKQIKIHSNFVKGCILDFRLMNYPSIENNKNETIKCFLNFSFKLSDNVDEDEIKEMRDDLIKYCESLLTFTFRQQNFTIEPDNENIYDYNQTRNIIEVLRPLNKDNKQSKLTPGTLKTQLNIKKLANLMLRSDSSIGYSVTLNLNGWTENEVSLILQGGIQSEDPFSKIGAYFARTEPEEETLTSNVEKPVCKMRFFSTQDLSQFFVSELLECISPDFLKTIKINSDDEGFVEELNEIKNFELVGKSNIKGSLDLEPLILKVYRSLGIDEIANICPVPHEPVPGIKHKKYTTYYPSITEISSTGIHIGKVRTEASTEYIDVRLSSNDRLRHSYIIGKTGTGKSSLLASMAIQDIVAGNPCIVIDPHGELCDNIIAAVPEKSLDNIVLIDPSKSAEYPACSLNVFDVGAVKSELELMREKDYWTNELTSMFISLYTAEIFGPRIQEYFRAACLTLMDLNIKGSFVDVPRLFTNHAFLEECRKKITDTDAREFWHTYDQMGAREKQEIIPYFTSKFSPLVKSFLIKNFVSSKNSSLDLEKFILEDKSILVRLSKGDLGELGMRLIGMLIISRIKSLIFARAKIEPEKRKFLSLYVDEFQNFVSEGFQILLSESRKFGLGLVLANQYLSQMNQAQFRLYGTNSGMSLLDAILGNVGNLIIFCIGAKDSKEILPSLGSQIEEKDLINLENFYFLGRILNSGVLSSPMTVQAYRSEFLNFTTHRNELKSRIEYLMELFNV